jgi:hypothetical protein
MLTICTHQYYYTVLVLAYTIFSAKTQLGAPESGIAQRHEQNQHSKATTFVKEHTACERQQQQQQ